MKRTFSFPTVLFRYGAICLPQLYRWALEELKGHLLKLGLLILLSGAIVAKLVSFGALGIACIPVVFGIALLIWLPIRFVTGIREMILSFCAGFSIGKRAMHQALDETQK